MAFGKFCYTYFIIFNCVWSKPRYARFKPTVLRRQRTTHVITFISNSVYFYSLNLRMRVQIPINEGYVTNHQHIRRARTFSVPSFVCDRSALKSGTSRNTELFKIVMERRRMSENADLLAKEGFRISGDYGAPSERGLQDIRRLRSS